MRRILRPAVEPECPGLYRADLEQSGRRPGICGKTRPNLVLVPGFHDVQGLLAVTNWPAEDDEAVVDEPVHECRVLGPALLVPDRLRGIPAGTVDQPYREVDHVRSVWAVADIQDLMPGHQVGRPNVRSCRRQRLAALRSDQGGDDIPDSVRLQRAGGVADGELH